MPPNIEISFTYRLPINRDYLLKFKSEINNYKQVIWYLLDDFLIDEIVKRQVKKTKLSKW